MELSKIPVAQIAPNPEQPRKEFDRSAMEDLIASVQERGILQPLLVEEGPDGGYILHAGERRLRAAKAVGMTEVPAQIIPALNGDGRQERIINAYVENSMRSDMTPIEEAQALDALRQLGLNNIQISQKTGVNLVSLASRLLLLELDPELQAHVADGTLPRDARVTKALLSVNDREARVALGTKIARPGVSIKAVVNACNRLNEKMAMEEATAGEEVPAIALSDAGKVASPKPQKWERIRVAAQAACDACDVKASLNGVAEPAWSLVISSARGVCEECSLRPSSHSQLDVCRQCPAVDLLKRLVPNA